MLRVIGTGEGSFTPSYPLELPLREKIETVARRIYHADGVTFLPAAEKELKRLEEMGFGSLPICVAKTQYSFSDDPALLGAPKGFSITVRRVKVCAGARFVVVYTGEIMTMPGLPKAPAAERINLLRQNNNAPCTNKRTGSAVLSSDSLLTEQVSEKSMYHLGKLFQITVIVKLVVVIKRLRLIISGVSVCSLPQMLGAYQKGCLLSVHTAEEILNLISLPDMDEENQLLFVLQELLVAPLQIEVGITVVLRKKPFQAGKKPPCLQILFAIPAALAGNDFHGSDGGDSPYGIKLGSRLTERVFPYAALAVDYND